MAKALGHQWGQIIGKTLQDAIRETLETVRGHHSGLYLDYQHKRAARGGLSKVAWKDSDGNVHDLDYVLEIGGTEERIGDPVAFIEVAWRRYTRHSKAKAQEIEGAVKSIAQTYAHHSPFLGIVLAGYFTSTSLSQLRSKGFTLVDVSYPTVLAAFSLVGIDASYDEDTSEDVFALKIRQWEGLSAVDRQIVKRALLKDQSEMAGFVANLEASLGRQVERLTVTILHGETQHVATPAEAIAYIRGYGAREARAIPIIRYDINVRYNNADVIQAIFHSEAEAVCFLENLKLYRASQRPGISPPIIPGPRDPDGPDSITPLEP